MNQSYLGSLGETAISPKKEIIINEEITIKGEEMLLLALTSEKYGNNLWILSKGNEEEPPIDFTESHVRTNRENLMPTRKDNISYSLKSMEIQGKKLLFSGSSIRTIIDDNRFDSGIIPFSYFLGKGFVEDKWLSAKKLILTQINIRNIKLPKIRKCEDLNIKLETWPMSRDFLIGENFSLPIGERPKGEKYFYKDPLTGEENFFFLNKIEIIDPWEGDFYEEKIGNHENILSEHKELILKGYRNLCPKGHVLPIIYYETSDNRQLDFYTKDYLDSSEEISCSNTIGLLFTTDEEENINGFKARICSVNYVEKGLFTGNIDVELFKCYVTDRLD